jgi:Immunoglobulin-like domain of bacterial spore germination
MTGSGRSVEDRLSDALEAEGGQVLPSDGSLDAIRSRVGAVHRRRRVALAAGTTLALVAIAIAVPVMVGDRDRVTTDSPPASSPTSAPAPGPGTTDETSTTSVPGAADPDALQDAILWPSPDGPGVIEPREAALSFLTEVVGVTDPALSSFQSERPGLGTFDLYERAEDGTVRTGRVASTIEVRRFDDGRWFVTGASSADVVISSPTGLTAVASPLQVEGEGHGFEGTIVVSLLARSTADSGSPLGSVSVIAGSGEALEPFSVSLPFSAPAAPDTGILLASDTSGLEDGVTRFSALAVRLGAAGTPPPTVAGWEFRNQPLYPFATEAEAEAWRVDPSHQPWHADPEATALSFVDYLAFPGIDVVTSSDVRDTDAWIGVGYTVPPGAQPSTSAVIHLQRFGAALDSPWEVVGTRDTDLTLETPRYGAAAGPSPLTVGGHITGVDENLRIQVRQLAATGPIGEACCLPAGGQDAAWETTVTYGPAADQSLLVVVSTGGHLQEVERFAITGLRPG